jgi:ParB-like chromosome segregation protein Spo0J
MNIVTRKISLLTPHPDNPRQHPAEQMAVLVDSLRIHGQQKNCVITSDNVILAGHGLVAAAKLAGLQELDCQIYDGPYPEAFIAMDNRSSDLSSNDDALLAQLLQDLQQADVPYEAMGFTESDITDLLKSVASDGKTLTGDGEDQSNLLTELFQIIITCDSEHQQVELLERFSEEGILCRALIS